MDYIYKKFDLSNSKEKKKLSAILEEWYESDNKKVLNEKGW